MSFIVNPKFLDDILWNKDLSAKDYFKIEKCTNVKIGSFTATPTSSNEILICLRGIRMTINTEGEFKVYYFTL